MFKKPEELWITNISQKQDVVISDLRITLRSGQSVNLLAKKKNGKPAFNITREQIDRSLSSGTLFKKSNVIKVRKVPPVVFNSRIDIADNANRSTRFDRKPTEIENPDFPDLDDLEIDDESQEQYALENAELDFADRMPILPVDPAFKKPTVSDE